MAIFGFLKRPQLTQEDELLGPIRFDRRSSLWKGGLEFPDARGPAQIAIHGTEDGPPSEYTGAFSKLVKLYRELRESIAESLFELYENYLSDASPDEFSAGLPRIEIPAEIWDTTALVAVNVLSSSEGSPRVQLTYTFDWHAEHRFCVEIEDWKVAGVAVTG